VTHLDSYLARVDKQIAKAVQRIARQRKLIERLREHRHDTTSAEQLLKVMAQTGINQGLQTGINQGLRWT
jgi:hypothetical protein